MLRAERLLRQSLRPAAIISTTHFESKRSGAIPLCQRRSVDRYSSSKLAASLTSDLGRFAAERCWLCLEIYEIAPASQLSKHQ